MAGIPGSSVLSHSYSKSSYDYENELLQWNGRSDSEAMARLLRAQIRTQLLCKETLPASTCY